MSKAKNASTSKSALAAIEAPGSAPLNKTTVTRAEATSMLIDRAFERYNAACAERDERIAVFESDIGRSDRIDASLLNELQRLQVRFAAINARQQRSSSYTGTSEPKVSKYVDQLGAMIGQISAHIATDRALELFRPVKKEDYVGWDGERVGQKGHDDELLASLTIVDNPKSETEDEPDDDVCLHENTEPTEDGFAQCVDCDEEVEVGRKQVTA